MMECCGTAELGKANRKAGNTHPGLKCHENLKGLEDAITLLTEAGG